MSSLPPQRRARPWGFWLAALLGSVLLLLGVGLARNPKARRRVRRKAENAWVGMEDLAERQGRRLARRRLRLEAGARRVIENLWDVVDDLPGLPERSRVPPMPGRLYVHGAFMGAAPSLLGDERWRAILAFLMPDVFRDVRSAVRTRTRVAHLIPMFENNPVMAAFGVWRAGHGVDGGPHAVEWDVYLDGAAVEAWQDADDPSAREAIVESLVSTMVIAHASTTDTVQQQIGLCQWADVRRTPKAQLGGVEPATWLDLFGRALFLAGAPDLRAAVAEMAGDARSDSPLECRRHTFVDPWSSDRVSACYRAVSGRPRFGVVLELKSLRCGPELLCGMVRVLNRRHIEVVAVGSFVQAEVRGVHRVPQLVDGVELPGPREIVFLHFVGDLQQAVDRRVLDPGSSVMFNGASLLVARPPRGTGPAYRVDEAVVDDLERYRVAHGLSAGLYVQESDCDALAAELLAALVVRRPETFALGFAWGGLADEVALRHGSQDHRGFGSQGAMRRFSRSWTFRPT